LGVLPADKQLEGLMEWLQAMAAHLPELDAVASGEP